MGKGSRYAGVERYGGIEGVRWIGRASKRLPDGRRIYWEEAHPTETAAYKARRDWLATQEGGRAVPRNKLTLTDAIRTWIDTHVVLQSANTQRIYGDTVRTHLLPARIARVPLSSIDTGTIQDWYNSLAHLGTWQRNAIHARLCQVLDLAVRHRRMEANPARMCTVPPHISRRGVALTDEQVAAFLAAAGTSAYRPLWHVAVATGMRRGELLGLRWQDVDFVAGTLTVNHTLIWVYKSEGQDKGKTPSSLRPVKVGDGVIALLRAQQGRQSRWRERAGALWQDSGAVFSTRHGKHLAPPDVLREKKRLMAAANLPKELRLHDLRHTHLSYLINQGVPIASVAARGGYKNAAILLATYTHADQAGQQMAVNVAEELLNRAGGDLAGKLHLVGIPPA